MATSKLKVRVIEIRTDSGEDIITYDIDSVLRAIKHHVKYSGRLLTIKDLRDEQKGVRYPAGF